MFLRQVVFWRPGVPRPNNYTLSRKEWLFGLAACQKTTCFLNTWFLALVPQASEKPLRRKTTSGSLFNRTLGFFIHGFWAGRRSSILGVWADPKIVDSRPAQKSCIKNPSVCCFKDPQPRRAQWALAMDVKTSATSTSTCPAVIARRLCEILR